jgi:hypothetical protein
VEAATNREMTEQDVEAVTNKETTKHRDRSIVGRTETAAIAETSATEKHQATSTMQPTLTCRADARLDASGSDKLGL